MDKTVLWIVIVLVVVIGAYIVLGSNQETTKIENSETQTQLTGETKEFDIIATNWEFNPSLIEVNKGDKVELHLQSTEGTHGFTILEFGIAETLREGEDVHAEFIADKAGTFSFFCHIPCGIGHGGMNGKLIVN